MRQYDNSPHSLPLPQTWGGAGVGAVHLSLAAEDELDALRAGLDELELAAALGE